MLRALVITLLAVCAADAAGLDDVHRILNVNVPPACTCRAPERQFSPAAAGVSNLGEPPFRDRVTVRSRSAPGSYCFQPGYLSTAAFTAKELSCYAIPPWLPGNSFARLRLYSRRGGNPDEDLPLIYYDSKTLYIPDCDTAWFFTGGVWMRTEGSRRRPVGTIAVTSDPTGARVVLDGGETRLVTPASLDSVPVGQHTVELHLADYRFNRRSVVVRPDSSARLSFSLVSDLDTVFIRENPGRAVLMLAEPPADAPYRIDNDTAKGLTIPVEPGTHRVRWDGNGVYATIDTTITVPPAQVTFFDLVSERLTGGLSISAFPPDARIMLDDTMAAIGEFMASVTTGTRRVSVSRNGYDPVELPVIIRADSMTALEVTLVKHADRDGDGFADSVDRCPDVYGIYDGCPKPDARRAATLLLRDAWTQLQKDPFAVDWSLVGYLRKMPIRQTFREFLTNFDGGVGGTMNNYRGFEFGNELSISWKGFFASLELGQWLGGLHYRRSDTLTLTTATDRYLVYFDTLSTADRTEPEVIIASTAPTIGFHFPIKTMNVCYGIGYQFESITIDDLRRASDRQKVQVVFGNNWWYHEIRLEDDFHLIPRIVPSLYLDFKIPFGPVQYTQWVSVQAGLSLKFIRGPKSPIGVSLR